MLVASTNRLMAMMEQHYKKFEGCFMPFVNFHTCNYDFEGELDDDSYDYILDEIAVLKAVIPEIFVTGD